MHAFSESDMEILNNCGGTLIIQRNIYRLTLLKLSLHVSLFRNIYKVDIALSFHFLKKVQ